MNENTVLASSNYVTDTISCVRVHKAEPQRIQVSCIVPEESAFPPPREFNLKRGRFDHTHRSAHTDLPSPSAHYDDEMTFEPNFAESSPDFIEFTTRSVRVVGSILIAVSVLLLVFDGILRNTLGL